MYNIDLTRFAYLTSAGLCSQSEFFGDHSSAFDMAHMQMVEVLYCDGISYISVRSHGESVPLTVTK